MKKTNKPKIVYIEFDDHCTNNTGWQDKRNIAHTVCFARTVGFIIKETEKYLTLALLEDYEGDAASHTFTVVKSTITKRKTLRLSGNSLRRRVRDD